jgi:hypothetical protein
MAHLGDPFDGASEIGKLLDLLNAADEHDETAEPAAQKPEQHQTKPTMPLGYAPAELALDSAVAQENKFAAHIVQGMLKMRRGRDLD